MAHGGAVKAPDEHPVGSGGPTVIVHLHRTRSGLHADVIDLRTGERRHLTTVSALLSLVREVAGRPAPDGETDP